MPEHRRIEVDVDDPGVRRRALAHLMGVVRNRQPGPYVKGTAASQLCIGERQRSATADAGR